MIQTRITPNLRKCHAVFGTRMMYKNTKQSAIPCPSQIRCHSHCMSRHMEHKPIPIPVPHRHTYRRPFSSKDLGNSSDETLISPDGDETNKPLSATSTLSPDDLNLAMQAANEQDQEISVSTTSSLNIDDIPRTSTGGSRKLAIIYTCNVCNTRSAKRFTERAYNHGLVLITCPKCESMHLIADRLGYFSDSNDGDGKGWDIETFMKSIGQEDNVKVATDGKEVLEVTLKDVLGDKMPTRTAGTHEDDEK